MIRDLARTLEGLLEPEDTVFDFSNAPGVVHYLLGLPPSTRYYHVSFAIRRALAVRPRTRAPCEAGRCGA